LWYSIGFETARHLSRASTIVVKMEDTMAMLCSWYRK
jgi:hypothetical protein